VNGNQSYASRNWPEAPGTRHQRPKPEHAMFKGRGQTAEQRRHARHFTTSSQKEEGSKNLPMGAGAPAAASSEHTPRA